MILNRPNKPDIETRQIEKLKKQENENIQQCPCLGKESERRDRRNRPDRLEEQILTSEDVTPQTFSQNKRRVHVGGPFVLVYEVNEKEKIVTLFDFDHHDNIYKA